MYSREGKFRDILKYRAKGDEYLKNILNGCVKRNKYTNDIIRNQNIEAYNAIILKKIVVDKVNSSKCFSILAEETTDVATNEQLSISIRFVEYNDMLHEDFLQFFKINSLTGFKRVTTHCCTHKKFSREFNWDIFDHPPPLQS